ncbi:alpha-1,2-fucosyltransferase [Hymenobacter terricola]|uniref:alpha-1,2-fucosyltransferase n=1 Tax=Hymenobacter terricola TaxID=2819236 RepID=UPI001B30BC88|nr:alpha-1,2-fucosyltransferase [Hymenobacter terricola]
MRFDTTNLLDRTQRPNFTFRDFELGVFSVEVPLATEADCALYVPLPPGRHTRIGQRLLRKLLNPRRYLEQQHAVYDAGVLQAGTNTYFEGYWQSEKYFKPCEALIRQAFAFKAPLTDLNRYLADEMLATSSIAMHVRRGDYVTNSLSSEIHGTCTPAYYREAIALMQEQIGDIALFVFSDEPEWVRENLHFPVPTTYISHNQGKASYTDMQLMSLCRHNIIANSSFSWWGAWLNANPNKIVVAPRQWVQDAGRDTTDLIPSEWIRL